MRRNKRAKGNKRLVIWVMLLTIVILIYFLL